MGVRGSIQRIHELPCDIYGPWFCRSNTRLSTSGFTSVARCFRLLYTCNTCSKFADSFDSWLTPDADAQGSVKYSQTVVYFVQNDWSTEGRIIDKHAALYNVPVIRPARPQSRRCHTNKPAQLPSLAPVFYRCLLRGLTNPNARGNALSAELRESYSGSRP